MKTDYIARQQVHLEVIFIQKSHAPTYNKPN